MLKGHVSKQNMSVVKLGIVSNDHKLVNVFIVLNCF